MPNDCFLAVTQSELRLTLSSDFELSLSQVNVLFNKLRTLVASHCLKESSHHTFVAIGCIASYHAFSELSCSPVDLLFQPPQELGSVVINLLGRDPLPLLKPAQSCTVIILKSPHHLKDAIVPGNALIKL